MSTSITLLMLATVTAWCVSAGHAQTTKPAEREFAVTPLRVQQLSGAEHYVYAEGDTTFANLKQTIDKLMPVVDALHRDRSQSIGEYVFVYRNATMEPDKTFKLQIGFPVKPGTAPPAGAKVRKLDSIRAATVVYTGSLQNIGQAVGQFYGDVAKAGLEPTGEYRESYVYREGPESTNNVIIIQAAVK